MFPLPLQYDNEQLTADDRAEDLGAYGRARGRTFRGIIDFGLNPARRTFRGYGDAGEGWSAQWQAVFDQNIAQGRTPEVAAQVADALFGAQMAAVWKQAAIEAARRDQSTKDLIAKGVDTTATVGTGVVRQFTPGAIPARGSTGAAIDTTTATGGGGAAGGGGAGGGARPPAGPSNTTMMIGVGVLAFGAILYASKNKSMGSYGYARRKRKSKSRRS